MPQSNLADRMRAAHAASAEGTAIAKRGEGATVFDLIERQKPAFRIAMPTHAAFSVDRFVRVALTSLRMNPGLLRCEPNSLLAALMLSAQLGLEPGGPLGHAYLVPYGRELTFIIGYKGLMTLARRNERIASIYAIDVREGDTFRWSLGLHRDIVHEPGVERGDLTHVYAVATYRDGSDPDFVVLDRHTVERFRARSKAKNNGPWVTDYDAMALKTAIRRLATWLPLSVEMAQAVAVDETVIDAASVDIIDAPERSEGDAADEREADADGSDGTDDPESAESPSDDLFRDGGAA